MSEGLVFDKSFKRSLLMIPLKSVPTEEGVNRAGSVERSVFLMILVSLIILSNASLSFELPLRASSNLGFLFEKKKSLTTSEYVENVASAKGEVSALSHAELLISHCERLNDRELINFFEEEENTERLMKWALEPSEPVNPCTITLESLFTKTLICCA